MTYLYAEATEELNYVFILLAMALEKFCAHYNVQISNYNYLFCNVPNKDKNYFELNKCHTSMCRL